VLLFPLGGIVLLRRATPAVIANPNPV